MKPTLVILGEFTPTFLPHVATDAAIAQAAAKLDREFAVRWVSTADISEKLFDGLGSLWIAPGSPYKNLEKTLWAIRQARERKIPCLGTCGGFQHLILEYARNVLGFEDAQHAEYDPNASRLFISRLACSLVGRTMTLRLKPGSMVARAYGATTAAEQYYCNFGVNPECVATLASRDLRIVGSDDEGEVRIIELSDHPFFVGTLFVPQLTSTAARPHPLITAFLKSFVS